MIFGDGRYLFLDINRREWESNILSHVECRATGIILGDEDRNEPSLRCNDDAQFGLPEAVSLSSPSLPLSACLLACENRLAADVAEEVGPESTFSCENGVRIN